MIQDAAVGIAMIVVAWVVCMGIMLIISNYIG